MTVLEVQYEWMIAIPSCSSFSHYFLQPHVEKFWHTPWVILHPKEKVMKIPVWQ